MITRLVPTSRRFVRTVGCLMSAIVVMLAGVAVQAQPSLDLTDKLPPYLMSALLLNNGHFSVSTRYTGEAKTLIYKEDGTGGRPVNYTSHMHIKVDETVFQLPFEVDPTTDFPPPRNPMRVMELFRDTVAGRPRINARLLALMPNSDSIVVVFTMEPVARPGGGFIRISVDVENRSPTPHDVGVLLLVDTKIGDNDRAPIATALGYSAVETRYVRSVAPGVPDFWLALEETPLAPGLAARGNLRAEGLITPDVFMFGNWLDDLPNGVQGLFRVLFDERLPSDLPYTDSAILLLWQQQRMAARLRKLLAATEIGVSDSLDIASGDGGSGGGGGGNGDVMSIAGTGTCLTTDTATEVPCGIQPYHPYRPDTLQALYLVTNTAAAPATDVRLVSGPYERGLLPIAVSAPVVQATLDSGKTGVGVVSVGLLPRLYATTYALPVAVVRNVADTVLRDTLCISVPGLLGSIEAQDITVPPICPTATDTILLPVRSAAVQCMEITSVTVLPQGTPGVTVVEPWPEQLVARGTTTIPVALQPTRSGTFTVRIRITARAFETLSPGDTTSVEQVDTATITYEGRPPALDPVLSGDTLMMVDVCVGDTARDEAIFQNGGGCAVTVTGVQWLDDAAGRFRFPASYVLPTAGIPVVVNRGERFRIPMQFVTPTAGLYRGILQVQTNGSPRVVTVPVRIIAEGPHVVVEFDTLDVDTICPGVPTVRALRLRNPTACAVVVDTVIVAGSDIVTVLPAGPFTISPNGTVSVTVQVTPTGAGAFTGRVRVRTAAGDQDVVVRGMAARRSLGIVPPSIEIGDVRVGQTGAQDLTVVAGGDAPTTVAAVRIGGPQATECTVVLPPGITLPATLVPGQSMVISVRMTPADIDQRRATVTVVAEGVCDDVPPVDVRARGISPMLDIEPRILGFEPSCIGTAVDTSIRLVNRGNAPLQVFGLTEVTAGAPVQTTTTFPVAIDSGSSVVIPLRIEADRLGRFSTTMSAMTDGAWFTPADTTFGIQGRALLCATLSLDTIDADIGMTAPIVVTMTSDVATIDDRRMVDLIDETGGAVRIRLVAEEPLLRMRPVIGGHLAGATLTTTGNETVIAGDTPLGTAGPLAVVTADVVLGAATRTALSLVVDSLARGDVRLSLLPGLVRGRLCALDNRFVQPSAQAATAWFGQNGDDVRVHATERGTWLVSVLDVTGRVVQSRNVHLDANTSTSIPLFSWIRPERHRYVLRLERQ